MLNAGATCSTRQGSTCEELLVDVGLCKAVASATVKKDFVKKQENVLEELQMD